MTSANFQILSDQEMILGDGVAAMTATGYSQNAGGNAQIDLGQDVNYDGYVRVNVSAIDVSNTDNIYTFRVVGSNASDFSSGVYELGAKSIGHATALVPGDATTGVGVYRVAFSNSDAPYAAPYRYIRLHVTVVGTSKTITFTALVTN